MAETNKYSNDIIAELFQSESTLSLEQRNEVIKYWHLARLYAELELRDILLRANNGKLSGSPLHISVEGTSPAMIAIIREICLRAHYIDFNENGANDAEAQRSIITVLYDGEEEAARSALLNAPYLGNFMHYCLVEPLTFYNDSANPREFLDIRIQLKHRDNGEKADVTESQIREFEGNVNIEPNIDIRKAKLVNKVYCVGDDLYNLPDINSSDVSVYSMALCVFRYGMKESDVDAKWDALGVKEKLSNILCSDNFSLRKERLLMGNGDKLHSLIENNITALSQCEHMRWVTEKLILGFKPWTRSQHYQYSLLFEKEKRAYCKKLKAAGFHLDICSNHDLARLDPGNRKFDTFLMISMEYIKD